MKATTQREDLTKTQRAVCAIFLGIGMLALGVVLSVIFSNAFVISLLAFGSMYGIWGLFGAMIFASLPEILVLSGVLILAIGIGALIFCRSHAQR